MDLSGLLMLYALGFDWDPSNSYLNLAVQDALECSAVKGLLMKIDEEFVFYSKRLKCLLKVGFIREDEWNSL